MVEFLWRLVVGRSLTMISYSHGQKKFITVWGMTWEQMADYLYEQIEKVPQSDRFGDFVGDRKMFEAYLQLLEGWNGRVDQVCEMFAKTGQWPTLIGAEEILVQMRLYAAWNICDDHMVCQEAGLASRSEILLPQEEALRFLLIYHWHRGGSAQIGDMIQEFELPEDAETASPSDDFSRN